MKYDIEQLTRDAFDAFWGVIAKHFPEVKTGDLSPETTIRLTIAAEDAVREWVRRNARKRLRRLVSCHSLKPSSPTPGPWFVDHGSPYAPYCVKPYPGRIVCDIEGSDAEAEANAHLIAAAPELLAACDGACGLLYRDKRGIECIDFAAYQRAENVCKSASAKARESHFTAVA
jgi:hypothetical protein